MACQRLARLSTRSALLALMFLSACQSTPGGGGPESSGASTPETPGRPAVGEIQLATPPTSLFDLPNVTSNATLTLTAGNGLRTVPTGVDADAYSPTSLADKATERLINAFRDTNAFSKVERTGPGSGLSGRIYSLDVVLNTSVDIQPDPPQQSRGLVLLRIGSGPKKPKTLDFTLDTESSMFSFGTAGGPKLVLADMNGIAGSTTSEPDGEGAQLETAWSAALDAAVPHIVRAVLRTVAEEEARLPSVPPSEPTVPAAPVSDDAPPQNTPAPLPELEPLPDLDDLEELPSLE